MHKKAYYDHSPVEASLIDNGNKDGGAVDLTKVQSLDLVEFNMAFRCTR